MLGLPRRFLKQVTFFLTFLVFAFFLILYANKQKVIHISEYLPTSFTPSYFQPLSDKFISDIQISSCFKINSKNPECGFPSNSGGIGTWARLEKDLNLGNSWFKKHYLVYKLVTDDEIEGREPISNDGKDGEDSKQKRAPAGKSDSNSDTTKLVVVDIAIESSVDSTIMGNVNGLPEHILGEFHKAKSFDDEELARLLDEKGGEEGVQLQKEKAKSEKEKAEKEKIELQFHLTDGENEGAAAQQKEKENDIEVANKMIGLSEAEDTKAKRGQETSRHALSVAYSIPTLKEVEEKGWVKRGNGLWLKFGSYADKNAITGVDVLFGEDCVDPRPNWKLLKAQGPLKDLHNSADRSAYLSIRRGPREDYKKKQYQPTLKIKDGKFKILQVADLHFSTGVGSCRDPWPKETAKDCEADPRTLRFLERVLDLEKPDFVVLTGDQIMGDSSPDAETSVFKALNPFIQRKIPFAVTMGNHDDEGSLSREEIFALSSSLPYSFSEMGPKNIEGVGNYILKIARESSLSSGINMYFLDTHKYSPNPKVNPGYDWLKESQIKWLQEQSFLQRKGEKKDLNMAWFHIPLPEYKHTSNYPYVGELKEPPTAPRYNTGARNMLQQIGVHVASVGHDHVNDYCLYDYENKDSISENKIWLCYGGGAGEGGYGGWGGYIRRLRTFEIDATTKEIKTWKRKEDNPDEIFDQQIIVSNGEVVSI